LVLDGLNGSALAVIFRKADLGCANLRTLFGANLYQTAKMYRVHVEPIRFDACYVTDYGGKAIKNSRFSTDHILILPRAATELAKGTRPADPDGRRIQDLQSRYNVSDELAVGLLAEACRNGRNKQ
jgi:hypothetical protein